MTVSSNDHRYMLAAVRLARRGLGRVWPNPSVGALIVREDKSGEKVVVGRGVTGRPGTGHAEARALKQAGPLASGATCYVTLEPCSHFGRTPPCSSALINAGIGRVVIGLKDPNPRVSGRGIAMLRDAGIDVETGVELSACQDLHAGFINRITKGRPLVTLKMALSSDGFIGREGAEDGQAQIHLSGPVANRQVHVLRATHDAILVGIGTALADDPSLTCRLPGMSAQSPVRVILDSQARLPLKSNLVRTAADVPVWLITTQAADPDRLQALGNAGVLIIKVPRGSDGLIGPQTALAALSARGITSVLVEGGSHVASAFENADVIDRLMLARSKVHIGEGGIPPFAGRSLETILQQPKYALADGGFWGDDVFAVYKHR